MRYLSLIAIFTLSLFTAVAHANLVYDWPPLPDGLLLLNFVLLGLAWCRQRSYQNRSWKL